MTKKKTKKKINNILAKYNIDEQYFLDTLETVTKKLIYKFQFGYHTHEDIKQQAYIFAIEGLEKYDDSRPLENFLWTHIRNRLFNYKRNNYKRPDPPCLTCPFFKKDAPEDSNCSQYQHKDECSLYSTWSTRNNSKQKLMNLSYIDTYTYEHGVSLNNTENQEIIQKLDQCITDTYIRELYIKHKNNCKLSKAEFKKLVSYIQNNMDIV